MIDKCNCADWGMMDHLTSCPEHWSNKDKPMNNLPQAVTDRYVTNLLHNGINSEFRLDRIESKPWVVEERNCGYYYMAGIYTKNEVYLWDVGPTPQAALKNALSKAGVTFR